LLDIAIVGMSCRYPDSPDILSFWQNCLERKVCLTELTDQRWNHSAVYSANRRDRNRTHSQTAGLLSNVDEFAARYFQISPRRARIMDPQQRLALELTREALQDAGAERRPFLRERSGVFMGAVISEFITYSNMKVRNWQILDGQFGEPPSREVAADLPDINAYSLSGILVNGIASSVSQFFQLGGPAFTSDAACASSLVATTQACHYLRTLPPRKELSPVAVAGGVYLMFHPDNVVGFAKGSALAERECRPFDAQADGFILGEGAGVFVLKRLEDALADGDRIYSVIKGAVWNNDAGATSFMTPSREGQARLIRWGFEATGIEPRQVGYVECQATGAPAGDEVELSALNEVWDGDSCPVLGSIKANFGHTLSASGAAGLIRATMALHTRTLPPQTAWESWHPKLAEYSERFRILERPEAWTGEALASVSAFGFGGTNCFLLLASAPVVPPSPPQSPYFCPVSAPSLTLLKEHLSGLSDVLGSQGPDSVAYGLRLRVPQEWTLLSRGSDTVDLQRIWSAVLEHSGEEIVQGGGYLLGPTDKLKDLELEGWEKELRWLAGESMSVEFVLRGSLPPSPLERRSFWPVETLPGPRR